MDFSLALILSDLLVVSINVVAAIFMDLGFHYKIETIFAYLFIANSVALVWCSALFVASGLSVGVVVK